LPTAQNYRKTYRNKFAEVNSRLGGLDDLLLLGRSRSRLLAGRVSDRGGLGLLGLGLLGLDLLGLLALSSLGGRGAAKGLDGAVAHSGGHDGAAHGNARNGRLLHEVQENVGHGDRNSWGRSEEV
jgi:hypothetical protein